MENQYRDSIKLYLEGRNVDELTAKTIMTFIDGYVLDAAIESYKGGVIDCAKDNIPTDIKQRLIDREILPQ